VFLCRSARHYWSPPGFFNHADKISSQHLPGFWPETWRDLSQRPWISVGSYEGALNHIAAGTLPAKRTHVLVAIGESGGRNPIMPVSSPSSRHNGDSIVLIPFIPGKREDHGKKAVKRLLWRSQSCRNRSNSQIEGSFQEIESSTKPIISCQPRGSGGQNPTIRCKLQ
jgi:hypothetical protein